MKVYIGPYKRWIGPFQIADWFQYVGISEDRCDHIGEWLDDHTPLGRICEWIHSKNDRKEKIHIDYYDTWSMDHTLALVILPMLKQLKATKHGGPATEDEDVPEELRSTNPSLPPKENEWDIDENWFKRWEYIIDEMIWSFEQIVDEDSDKVYYKDGHFDMEKMKEYEARVANGFRLFGRYFQSLWD